MINIFYLAKYIARRSASAKIELEHFKKALSCVEIVDAKAREILDKIEKTNTPQEYFTANQIEEAIKAPSIDFSPDMLALRDELEKLELTVNRAVSKLSFKKKSSHILDMITSIKKELSETLYEQDMAVEAIADALMRNSYTKEANRPKAVFFFAGDVGSGKSFAAKAFADLMAKDGYEYKSFNMSNYTSDNESFVLNGLSKGYNGAKEGELTGFVKKNPRSIILFDSIEQAHNNVVNILNELLDSGFLTDNYSAEKIDFTQTILLFETNAGKEIFLKPEFHQVIREDNRLAESILLDAVSKELVAGYKDLFVLPREFLNRIADAYIIIFNKLTFESCVQILTKQLIKEQTNIEKSFNIEIVFEDLASVAKMLVLSSGPDFGIRKILKKAPFLLFDPITDFLIEHKDSKKKIVITLDESFLREFNAVAENQNIKTLLHNLFRKNRVGKFQIETEEKDDSISVAIKDFSIQTVKRVADFGGENGLIIEIPEHGFENIAGHNKVKTRLQEVIKIFKSKELNKEYSEFISKGMLLYGPPGTGKTMLAKAFAKEADLPFIATTGPDLLSEEAIKSVFRKAREYAPSIVFIDEIDVFKHRGMGYGTDILINKLLTEIDGFSNKDENRIFIIAATNLKSQIDTALLRSGRIDLHIEVDALDKDARKFFIENFLNDDKFVSTINIEKIVKMTAGFSGADLKKLERESILDAYRKSIKLIDEAFLVEHINIIKFGEIIENNKAIEETLELTAYHETGHAVASKILFPNKVIEQVTIIPRAKSLGFVSYEFREDVQHDIEELKNMICVSFAGRVAESKKYGSTGINSGAGNDLQKAMELAYLIVAEYGMIDNMKSSIFFESKQNLFIDKVQAQIEILLKELYEKTEALIEKYWETIELITRELLENETIYQDDMNKYFK